MKKLITVITLIASLFIASPAFAYTVKSGDTMSQIAVDNNLTLEELAKLNPQVEDLDLIYVGQTINTPIQESTNANIAYAAEPTPEISHISEAVAEEPKQDQTLKYSNEELDLLARLVRAEAQGESLQGKIAVACVVLNRVESSTFPNTIKGVIYQKGQFQPVRNGAINKPADQDSIKAVQEAINSSRHLAGASLFFYNPAVAKSRWLDSRTTTVVIGNHVFKR
jgi:N-acetylmuramoyl-L-alanine amidase